MQAVDRFELGVVRRLRAELDSFDVRLPAPVYGRQGSRRLPAFGLLRPLAIAAAAVIALAALATAVTRSPDPALWVQPSVWMHAFGVGPSSPTPTTQPDEAAPESPEAKPTTEPTNPEPESSETPGTSSREHESPDPRESESPSGGGSSPPGGGGPDG